MIKWHLRFSHNVADFPFWCSQPFGATSDNLALTQQKDEWKRKLTKILAIEKPPITYGFLVTSLLCTYLNNLIIVCGTRSSLVIMMTPSMPLTTSESLPQIK